MCGIAGSVSFLKNRKVSETVLQSMADEMISRGPDGSGIALIHDGRVGLAHRRLAIVDLSEQANQPMSNANNNIYITFNGEIYNHMELRREINQSGKTVWKTDHSDTETILHAYELWGIKCIKKLRGMFAFALWDGCRQKLWLVRDRLGIKPLYFSISEERINFASSVRALLADEAQDRTVDKKAVYDFLSLLAVPAPNTLFKFIKKLPAGTCMEVDLNGKLRKYRYWDIADYAKQEKRHDKEEDVRDRLLRLLRESAQIRKMGDVPVGVQLSGGIDSSTNLALVSENDEDVNSFTVGYRGTHIYENENRFARQMADLCAANYHEILIGEEDVMDVLDILKELSDDPVADPVMVSQYYIAKLAIDNGIKVVQCGEGADELFAGYTHWHDQAVYERINHLLPLTVKKKLYRRAVDSSRYSENQLELFRRAAEGEPLFWGAGGVYIAESRKKRLFKDSFLKEIAGHKTWDNFRNIYKKCQPIIVKDPLAWMAAVNMVFRLPDLLLARTDRACMAVSVEGRVPFLDHKLVEWGMGIPGKYKIRNKDHKHILKEAVGGILPDEIIDRKKEGFALPFGELSKGRISNMISTNIQTFVDESDFFNAAEIRKLISESRGDSYIVWALFTLSLWWQEYAQSN